MTKPTYFVKVVRKGRERDFLDFWERGRRQNDAGELLDAELVGFVEPVRASNRREAMVLVRARYPDHRISKRIGKKAGIRKGDPGC